MNETQEESDEEDIDKIIEEAKDYYWDDTDENEDLTIEEQ